MRTSPRRFGMTLVIFAAGALLLTAFFAASPLRAEEVEIMRDGSLVFELPNDRAAVLDILPRGTRVELMDRGPQWSEVMLSAPTRRGYIRTEALLPSSASMPRQEIPSPAAPPPQTARPAATVQQSAGSGPVYDNMMHSLDRTESRIRALERTLKDMLEMVDSLEMRRLDPRFPGRSRTYNDPGMGGPAGPRWAIQSVGGYYLDSRDYLAGVSLLWRPRGLKGISFELEGGYLIQDLPGADGAVTLNLGTVLPLGPSDWRVLPYAAAWAGAVRRQYAATETGPDTNPLASVGLGGFIRLSERVHLRAEFRSVFEFAEGDTGSDQRVGLSLGFRL